MAELRLVRIRMWRDWRLSPGLADWEDCGMPCCLRGQDRHVGCCRWLSSTSNMRYVLPYATIAII